MALRVAKGERATSVFIRSATVLVMLLALGVSTHARADWWSENVEIHGSMSSTVYFNAPSMTNDFQMDQWWNQLELDGDFKLINGEDNSLSFHTIILPTYDLAYDLYPHVFGDKREGASFGTQTAGPGGGTIAPTPVTGNAELAMRGQGFKGHGTCIDGAFCDVNQDTAFLFTGRNNPAMVVDNTIFFGILVTQTGSRSASGQTKLGGGPSMDSYQQAVRCLTTSTLPDCQLIRSAPGFSRANFLATVAAGQAARGNFAPVHSFGNHGQYVIGDRRSLERQLPAGINLTDGQLKTHCFDVAHPYCWAREFYFEAKFLGENQIRIGRQQIVWGKTDAFRLQDIVNPIDFSYHNVYPSLEDRRIPTLSADFVHSFGNMWGLEDVSLELVWVFDKFTPVYVGQCGDFWAFTAACEARADVGAHGLLNVSAARVEERKWTFHNTEPGFRLEWRTPEPSIAYSVSGFWGIQDAPVARFKNPYGVNNPNPAMMMFLQALGFDGVIPAFNPYDQASVQASSDFVLNNVYTPLAQACDAGAGTATGPLKRVRCYAGANAFAPTGFPIQDLGWIWGSSQAVVEYPRTFTMGASLDYQIPNIDTVLRFEAAYDFNRAINNSKKLDYIDHSDVVMAAIGLDRSIFIPFLNKDRTAFFSFQTFMEHIMSYDGNGVGTIGMTSYEDNVISTVFLQNYWRGDSIVLTNFFAYDWGAKAWITGPKLKWIYNESFYVEAGINLLQGRNHYHNISDICKDGSLNCLADPASWNPGQWQIINENLRRFAQSPSWNMESFADSQMKKRDEIWFGATYQF